MIRNGQTDSFSGFNTQTQLSRFSIYHIKECISLSSVQFTSSSSRSIFVNSQCLSVIGSQNWGEYSKKSEEYFTVMLLRALLPSVLTEIPNAFHFHIREECNQLVILRCVQALFALIRNGPLSDVYDRFLVLFRFARERSDVVLRLPRILTKLNQTIETGISSSRRIPWPLEPHSMESL
jgi:hypothetical protein